MTAYVMTMSENYILVTDW